MAAETKLLAESVLSEKSESAVSGSSSAISDAGSEFSTRGKRHRGKKDRPHEQEEAELFARLSNISTNENTSNAHGSNNRRRKNDETDEPDGRSSSQSSGWSEDADRHLADDSRHGNAAGPGYQRGGRGSLGGSRGGKAGRYGSRVTKFPRQIQHSESRNFNESHGADRDDNESQDDKRSEQGETNETRSQAGNEGSKSSMQKTSRHDTTNRRSKQDSKLAGDPEGSSSSLPERKLLANSGGNSDTISDERGNNVKKRTSIEIRQSTKDENGTINQGVDELARIENMIKTLNDESKKQTEDDDEASCIGNAFHLIHHLDEFLITICIITVTQL